MRTQTEKEEELRRKSIIEMKLQNYWLQATQKRKEVNKLIFIHIPKWCELTVIYSATEVRDVDPM